MKDYLKIIVTVVITFLATSFLNAVVNKSSATQKDLIVVKTEAFEYTDKSIMQHERVQNEQFQKISTQLENNMEYSRENKKILEKLLDIQLKR